jgi:hypothetical protein
VIDKESSTDDVQNTREYEKIRTGFMDVSYSKDKMQREKNKNRSGRIDRCVCVCGFFVV